MPICGSVSVTVVCLCLLCCDLSMASDAPQTAFFRANTLYSQGQYTHAAQAYEQLLTTGQHSGNLYFNLGNAYFKNDHIGKAILNYERARRIAPGDTDIEANLVYARSVAGTEDCPPRLWHRLVFPLTHRFSTDALVWITSAAYSLCLFAFTVYRLWPRHPRWLVSVALLCTGLFVIIGMSLVRQIFVNDWQRPAVVLADGQTPVRFEPAETGTEHFVLKQGALVRLLESRPGWHQIARCDGRRGWAAEQSVESLWQ